MTPPSASSRIVWSIAVVLLFLALRVPLLLAREPFFDELMTVWVADKPLAQHWTVLSRDSGMPLYYAIARGLDVLAGFDVRAGRILSLLFGAGALALLLGSRSAGPPPLLAAAALAVFPPHVFFSTEARPYALASLLIGVATVGLYRWSVTLGNGSLILVTLSLVLAAYAHPYGVLFFPLPLVVGWDRRARPALFAGAGASLAAATLFIPGFLLASRQPDEAIGWLRQTGLEWLASFFLSLGFATPSPAVFAEPQPLWLQGASLILVAAAVIRGVTASSAARFFLMVILVPLLGVFAFAAFGRTVYFPMRFESILGVPFAMLMAAGIASWGGKTFRVDPRRVMVGALIAIGLTAGILMIRDQGRRGPDPWRHVALMVRQRVDPRVIIVASGYAYLEVVSQIDREWAPRVIAFPLEQGLHPGWRRVAAERRLIGERAALPDRFVWVGALHTAESEAIGKAYLLRPFAGNRLIVAALAEKRRSGDGKVSSRTRP